MRFGTGKIVKLERVKVARGFLIKVEGKFRIFVCSWWCVVRFLCSDRLCLCAVSGIRISQVQSVKEGGGTLERMREFGIVNNVMCVVPVFTTLL